jgi:hypothetical protein
LDIERMLIAKVVADSNLEAIVDAGITHDFFVGAKNRQLFQTIWRFKKQYGTLPTSDILKRDHPTTHLPDPADYSLNYLVDQLRGNRERGLLSDGILEATEYIQNDNHDKAKEVLQQMLRRVEMDVPNSTVTDLTLRTLEERRAAYEELRKRDGRLLGIPSGFAAIDQVTQGFQPKQLITFVGLPKAGKSTLMLLAAMAAHEVAFRPFFIGFEMSNEEQEERHGAILSKVSHHRLRTGTLNATEYKRLERSWRVMLNMPSFFLCNDTQSATTLSGLQVHVERFKPDILFVDGVYMMRDEEGEPPGSPQALTNITRGFKRMAQTLDIPIVISTQALTWKTDKRRGITGNSIGYSSSFFQDSDLLMAVEQTELPDVNKVKIVGARNAQQMEKYIRWDWDTGVFEELDEDPFDAPYDGGGDGDRESGFGD